MNGDPVITSLSTRWRPVPLPRPWGQDVTEVHVIVVEVTASDGAVGTGFTWTPTIGARAVQAVLDHDIATAVVGGPTHPEVVWDPLWSHLHEAGSGIATIAMAGLDLALWDLLARRRKCSLPALLGRRRRELTAYGSGVNRHLPLDELVAQVERFVAAGYQAVKVKVGRPDLAEDVERVAAVRSALGPGRRLMIDANQRWDLPAALRAVEALHRFDLHWLEEPLRADHTWAHAELRSRTGIPIALGENVHHVHRFRDLIAAGAVDVVQPNIVRVGGITPFRRIAALAEAHGLEIAPHLLADLSAQIGVTLPAAPWIEEVEDTAFERLGLVDSSPVTRSGDRLVVHDHPGLGLRFA